jgi:hypothetical protein
MLNILSHESNILHGIADCFCQARFSSKVTATFQRLWSPPLPSTDSLSFCHHMLNILSQHESQIEYFGTKRQIAISKHFFVICLHAKQTWSWDNVFINLFQYALFVGCIALARCLSPQPDTSTSTSIPQQQEL